MLRFGLLGAGRIGSMHARNLAKNPRVELAYVYDIDEPAARKAAEGAGARLAPDIATILSDTAVDAVLIASPTNTHVDLIAQAAQAGKAVLCEKPIDLDITRANRCRDQIADCEVAIQIGFNRRFDPSHGALREAVQAGEIGRIEKLIITSRDPAPPPIDYVKVSGGLFRDMMIHDFDLARFVMGEEPTEISAMGSALVNPDIASLGDIDTAMVVMKMTSGALCHINCSRRAVYGYDQRIEAFGPGGMLLSNNRTRTTVERYGKQATAAREPLLNFFIERYSEAYFNQVNAFVDAVEQGGAAAPSFEDGRRALILANAAGESLETGHSVKVVY
jgi:myo-inositol 2-dehydrogenase/D-chiro-inositol 1-dehydrogenase